MSLRRAVSLAVIATTLAAAPLGAQTAFPSRIALPNGFQPEGIATAGEQFYAGSIPTGAVYRGSVRTGRGAVLVRPRAGRAAIGLKVDRGRIFVAGGSTGRAFVYDARTGAPIRAYALASGRTFVNDVAVTSGAAWFTDSFRPVLYRVPLGRDGRPGAPARTIRLSGDYEHGGGFNVNGIAATADGARLVIVHSGTGRLFAVTPTGVARTIALAGGESVPNGDGILLDGRTLYVAQNRMNAIAKIALAPNLRSGRVLRRISDPGLDVPTTIAASGPRLYAVNARFSTAATPSTEYWITRLPK